MFEKLMGWLREDPDADAPVPPHNATVVYVSQGTSYDNELLLGDRLELLSNSTRVVVEVVADRSLRITVIESEQHDPVKEEEIVGVA